MSQIYDLIVVGAGPCGVACVAEAQRAKIGKILLIEKGETSCQTIATYYKDGKRVDKEYRGFESENCGNFNFVSGNKESTIEYFDALLKECDCEVKFRREVGRVAVGTDGILEAHSASDVFKAKNIVVAIGKMGKPNRPAYEIPYNIAANVNFNVQKCSQNERILVVGGGNSASEYALGLSEKNDVTLSYRGSEFSRLNDINLADILAAKESGRVKIKFSNVLKSLEKSENGDILVTCEDGQTAHFNRIIYAIGGIMPVDFLENSGIAIDEKHVPILDENFQSNIKNLYLGGDLATKNGASIVVAMNAAYKIICNIKKNLG